MSGLMRFFALVICVFLYACSPEKTVTKTSGKDPFITEIKRPNFIVFLTDDQRYDALGIMGPGLKTPNMDKLARTGRF